MKFNPVHSMPLARPPANNTQDDPRVKKTLQEFEAMFMRELLAEMRKTVQKTNLFGDNKAVEMYSELLDQEYARMASEKPNNLGIKEALANDLVKKSYARLQKPSL